MHHAYYFVLFMMIVHDCFECKHSMVVKFSEGF